MAQESGWLSEFYITVLWGSRCWQDLYKVKEHSPETMGDIDKEYNQFISNRHAAEANSGTECYSSVPLLRLPGTEGPIGGKSDRGST